MLDVMKNYKARLLVLASAAALAGCAGVATQGLRAAPGKAPLQITSDVVWTSVMGAFGDRALLQYTLSQGTYPQVFEDDRGMYYFAGRHCLRRAVLETNTKYWPLRYYSDFLCGVYVPRSDSEPPKVVHFIRDQIVVAPSQDGSGGMKAPEVLFRTDPNLIPGAADVQVNRPALGVVGFALDDLMTNDNIRRVQSNMPQPPASQLRAAMAGGATP